MDDLNASAAAERAMDLESVSVATGRAEYQGIYPSTVVPFICFGCVGWFLFFIFGSDLVVIVVGSSEAEAERARRFDIR